VPVDQFRRALRQHQDLVQTLTKAWPLIEPRDVVGDLWKVPAYLRMCAPWVSPRRHAETPAGAAIRAVSTPPTSSGFCALGGHAASGPRISPPPCVNAPPSTARVGRQVWSGSPIPRPRPPDEGVEGPGSRRVVCPGLISTGNRCPSACIASTSTR
jgi:hypothetical protein